jgi:hypothetical protein
MEIKPIIEGWANTLFKKDDVETIAAERMEICNSCVKQSVNAKAIAGYHSVRPDVHCVECGCPLVSKTRALSSSCPLNKWKAKDANK